jgi:hypothetical protein
VIVVTCDWDCNKGINNPNGVFSGVTRYNWCSELIKNRNIVQYVSAATNQNATIEEVLKKIFCMRSLLRPPAESELVIATK